MAPAHLQSYGQAKRFVIQETAVLGAEAGDRKLWVSLKEFLFRCRNTPPPSISRALAELFLGRKLRYKLHGLKPQAEAIVNDIAQERQKETFDRRTRHRELSVAS